MKTKQDVIHWLKENKHRFTAISDEIWASPEVAGKEFDSSKLQADYLQAEGFQITWDIGGMNTAFIAEWGKGKPIIGFAGEYDALVGLSQKNQPTRSSRCRGVEPPLRSVLPALRRFNIYSRLRAGLHSLPPCNCARAKQ